MSQQQYSAALLRAQCISHCSVLLCKTGLVSLQVQLWRFAHQTSALQIRVTAGLCHCCDNCAGLLLIQVCIDPTEMHCSVDLGKMIPYCSVLPCKTGSQQTVCLCSYISGDLLFPQFCSEPTGMHCSPDLGKMNSSTLGSAL